MPESPCLIADRQELERPWSPAHVHAPRGDESFVAVPSLADAIELAHRNRVSLASGSADIQGRDLAVLRRWARCEVYRAAREYTAALYKGLAPTSHQHAERSA